MKIRLCGFIADAVCEVVICSQVRILPAGTAAAVEGCSQCACQPTEGERCRPNPGAAYKVTKTHTHLHVFFFVEREKITKAFWKHLTGN